MKKVIVFVMVALFATTSLFADDKMLSLNKLPASAQKFIKKHFANETVKYITTEGRSIYREYDVTLKSGTGIGFNSKGDWTKVDCDLKEVPKDLVPTQISKHIKSNFKGEFISEIERKKNSVYKVELSDGTELEFNKKFDVTAIDIE